MSEEEELVERIAYWVETVGLNDCVRWYFGTAY